MFCLVPLLFLPPIIRKKVALVHVLPMSFWLVQSYYAPCPMCFVDHQHNSFNVIWQEESSTLASPPGQRSTGSWKKVTSHHSRWTNSMRLLWHFSSVLWTMLLRSCPSRSPCSNTPNLLMSDRGLNVKAKMSCTLLRG